MVEFRLCCRNMENILLLSGKISKWWRSMDIDNSTIFICLLYIFLHNLCKVRTNKLFFNKLNLTHNSQWCSCCCCRCWLKKSIYYMCDQRAREKIAENMEQFPYWLCQGGRESTIAYVLCFQVFLWSSSAARTQNFVTTTATIWWCDRAEEEEWSRVQFNNVHLTQRNEIECWMNINRKNVQVLLIIYDFN